MNSIGSYLLDVFVLQHHQNPFFILPPFFLFKKLRRGGDGHRSHYLVHAKHALYHLSYTPTFVYVCSGVKL